MKKIVIVVGAGASQEFGMPTGAELMRQIGSVCELRMEGGEVRSNDRSFYSLLKHASQKFEVPFKEVMAGARLIGANMHLAPSIDNFLHTHSDNSGLVIAGKLAIFTCLKRAEESSPLFKAQSISGRPTVPEQASQTWLAELFKILASGRTAEQFLNDLRKIRFICFNYDRCIERFFSAAYESYFSNPGSAIDLTDYLDVLHPYGVLEQYDYKNFDGDKRIYGGGYSVVALEAPNNIRTFTEGSKRIDQSKLGSEITNSTIVIFLGFGFHSLNTRLLPGKKTSGNILATSYGISEANLVEIGKDIISGMFGGDPRYKSYIDFSNCKCFQLIWENSRAIERVLN